MRHVTSMEKCPRYKLSKGRRRAREWPEGEEEGRGEPGEKASHHPTDERLHHKCILEVADGIAVLGPTLVDPPPGGPAPQPIGVLPVAQVVDKGTQSLLVSDMLCHHHLLLDDVRLWEVGPSLHVHEELPEVSWGQHDGGVELNDVALVQGDVVVGSETLRGENIRQSLWKAKVWTRWP